MNTPRLGLIDRARLSLAKALLSSPTKQAQARTAFRLAWPSYRMGTPQWHSIDFDSFSYFGYELNSVVFSAIAYKQRSKSAAPLTAFQGDPLSATIAPLDHPLQRVAARPNAVQTGIELVQLMDCYYNIAGNAYCVIVRDGRETVKGLYPLRPDRVFIVPTEGGSVSYWYQPEGVASLDVKSFIPILADDMIHLKIPNPRDPLEGFGYGLSPLMPAGRSIDVHNETTDFLKLFFEHSGVPPGQITFEGLIGEETLENVKDQWLEKHGGYEKWPEPAVFEGGGKYEAIMLPFDQMGFGEIDSRTESLVLGPLGVPPILIGTRFGLERSTYSNYEEARKAYWEDTAEPELKQFGGEFQRVRMGDAWLGFDLSAVPALVERNKTRAETFDLLYAQGMGAYPSDQAAQIAGLPAPVWPERETPSTPEPAPAGETIAEQQGEPVPEKESPPVSLWTADALDLRTNVLAVVSDEKRAALADGRSVNWREVKRQWVDLALGQPRGGEWARMLEAVADFAYNEVLTTEQVVNRLQYAWGERFSGRN